MLIGATLYQAAPGGAIRFLRDARDQDVLMKHLRTMIEGAKELKLHIRRRAAFLANVSA